MVGKFILGMLSGGVLVTGGLVLGSAMFPLQTLDAANLPAAEQDPVVAPATVEAAVPEAEPAPEPAAEPVVEAVDAEQPKTEAVAEAASEPAIEVADGEPVPEVSAEVELPPEAPEANPTATVEPAAQPEAPPISVTSPAPPLSVSVPSVPTTPAPLPQLDADAVLAALDGAASESPPPPPKADVAVPQPAEGAEPTPEPAAEPSLEPVADPAPEPAPEPVPEPVLDPVAEPEPPVAEIQPAPEAEPVPQPEAAEPTPEPTPEPKIAVQPEVDDSPTFKSAPGLGDKTEGVIIGRLPRIGDAPAQGEDAELPEADAEAAPADDRPIVQFAANFENPDAKPVLAIVLIDPGTAELDRAALAALPFPVSFALDPLDPATPERAATYLAGGKEVVMLATGFPVGAQASDVEVAFQSMAQGLPEAVAVMDLSEAMFQNNRPLASMVVPVVGAQGRGLLTWDQGLNAADQVARREDIASAVVFRDLVSAGDDSTSIRRILDRAVFKAGQDGRVALAGTASQDTVAALLEWAVEGRAATVAIAPLTAVMKID